MSETATTFSLANLGAALDGVSDDIKREIGTLFPIAADQMVAVLQRSYPIGTKSHPGVKHMRDDIRVTVAITNAMLVSTTSLVSGRRVTGPRLAYIWQNGTGERSYPNTRSSGMHRTGRMPPADPDFFERTAIQTRAEMMARAQQILDRHREIG